MSARLVWHFVRVHSRTPHLPGYLRTLANFQIHRDVALFFHCFANSKIGVGLSGERGRNVDAVEWSGSAVEIGTCARDA